LTTDVHSDIISMMQYRIDFSEEKNLVLQEARGIGFEEVVEAIGEGNIVADFHHKNTKKYPHQRILAVQINQYIYAVPYVLNTKKGVIFLITVYPSRVLTKKYLKK